MAPFYEMICAETGQNVDATMLNEMAVKNEERIKAIEAEIVDTEQNLGAFLAACCGANKREDLQARAKCGKRGCEKPNICAKSATNRPR